MALTLSKAARADVAHRSQRGHGRFTTGLDAQIRNDQDVAAPAKHLRQGWSERLRSGFYRRIRGKAFGFARRGPRFVSLGAVVALHAAFAWGALALSPSTSFHHPDEALVSVIVRPRVVISSEIAPERQRLLVPEDAPIDPNLVIPDVYKPTLAIVGVGTVPPRPLELSGASSELGRRAGLRPGQGATVVLRLEVLNTGDVGRVDVEVSGGSREIDGAAVEYARSIRWLAGMVNGQPVTLWIRWGAHLEA